MLVRMVVARAWQHAGRERPLAVGEVVELPDSIARALVDDGSAVALAVSAPPETKPAIAPERKGRAR